MATEDVKFSITGDDSNYQTSLTRSTKATEQASKRMVSAFSEVDKSRSRGFSGAGGNSLGAVSLQAQDVAVQLQNGAKWSTVIAQQGSQIASIFGPGGAILGGALAIGAAIYTWVTGAKEAEKAFAAGEKRLKDMQSAGESLRSGAIADTQAAGLAGKKGTALAMARLEIDHENKLAAIREKAAQNGDKAMERIATAAEEQRYSAERKAIEEQQTLESVNARTEKERELESEKARGRSADAQRSALLLTDAEKLKQIEEEIAAIKNRSAVSSTASISERTREARSVANLAEKELEKAKLEQKIQEEGNKSARQGLEESIDRANKVAEIRKNIGELEDQKARELKKDEVDQSAEVGERIKEKAAQARMTPGEREAQRQEAKEQARAERQVIGKEIDDEDRRRRGKGMSGLSKDERDEMRNVRERGQKTAKNKEDIKASIDKDSIQELSTKIADEVAKLITK
jgi:hypothetical protein